MSRLPLTLSIVLSATQSFACSGEDDPIKYLASPDGSYKAVIYKGGSGVTTRPRYYLRVLRSTERIDDRVSPFTLQTPYYGGALTPADYANIARIDIQWASNDSLIASIDPRAEIMPIIRDLGCGVRLRNGVPDGVRLVLKTR